MVFGRRFEFSLTLFGVYVRFKFKMRACLGSRNEPESRMLSVLRIGSASPFYFLILPSSGSVEIKRSYRFCHEDERKVTDARLIAG